VLRRVWPGVLHGAARPVWQVRRNAVPGDVLWDIGAADYAGPALSGGVILHLAGGRADLGANVALALNICDVAATQDVRHVFIASSSAVYAPDPDAELTEDTPPAPTNDYGLAKLAMERAVTAQAETRGSRLPGITFLRIGNVLGSDSLVGGAVPGRQVMLTPVPGRAGGPLRSYIGPRSFADALAQLCLRALKIEPLPRILNIGTAPPVAMADLLDAAGLPWAYGGAGSPVIPRLVLSVDRMMGLVALPADAGLPATMVAEWRMLQDRPE
jgi:NDP-hexose 4-ketoreductase